MSFFAPGVAMPLVDGSLDGPFLIARLVFEPGAAVPADAHPLHTEVIVVLAGDVVVTRGGAAIVLDAGAFPFAIEAGAEHAVVAGRMGAEIVSILRRVQR